MNARLTFVLLGYLLLKLSLFYFFKDFALNANRTYPTSCCTSDITEQISIGRRPLASAIMYFDVSTTIN